MYFLLTQLCFHISSRRHHLYHSQRSTRTIDGSNCVPSTMNGGVHQNSNGNKSYTIGGHSRQRSQPESSQNHAHHQSPPPQPIYAQHMPVNRRPASSYYEYESNGHHVLQNGGSGSKSQHSSPRKMSAPSPPSRPQWNGQGNGSVLGGGSMRGSQRGQNGGPYVTQVQIQQQKQFHQNLMAQNYAAANGKQQHPQMPSASKV